MRFFSGHNRTFINIHCFNTTWAIRIASLGATWNSILKAPRILFEFPIAINRHTNPRTHYNFHFYYCSTPSIKEEKPLKYATSLSCPLHSLSIARFDRVFFTTHICSNLIDWANQCQTWLLSMKLSHRHWCCVPSSHLSMTWCDTSWRIIIKLRK